ncbi:unnamed protein product [Strongylus vulgaris]|uniref:Uncharacterized protein n=1 Tax=Strongylus vulgaris TaxID=40348 RepID=A0A3P7IFZ8_STRVU|nr:unnamed protein product [Strongylus vulgaris]
MPHVRLPGLCFLQGDYVIVDAPCSFEKDVKIGVGGGSPGVVVQSMRQSPRRVVDVSFRSKIRGIDTGLDDVRRRRCDPVYRASFSLTCCTDSKGLLPKY